MLRTTRLRVAAIAVLGLLAALPGVARAAAWLAPTPLNLSPAFNPSIGVDAAGNAIAAWETKPASTFDTIQGARHTVGVPGFQPLTDFANDAALPIPLPNRNPVVAMNRAGSGLVAWVHDTLVGGNTQVDMRTISPGGVVGPITTISGLSGAHGQPVAAVADNGDAVVAWLQGSANIEAATRSGAAGTFVASPTLDTAATGSPRAVIDKNGNALVLWPSNAAPAGLHYDSHVSGSWLPGGSIADSAHIFTLPSLSANPNGQAVVVFRDLTLAVLRTVKGSVSGGFGATPTIQTIVSPGVQHGPGSAIDDNGNATIGWTTASGVQFSSAPSAGLFGPPQSITPVPFQPASFELAGNGRGDVVASWYSFEVPPSHNVVRAAVKPAGSATFGLSQIISDQTRDTNGSPTVLDEQGDAFVGLPLFSGMEQGVEAVVYDGSPPVLGTPTHPASLQQGKSGAFSVTATDAFTATTVSWSFGDGSAATTGSSVSHTYTRSGRFTVTVTATDAASNRTSTTFTVNVTSAPPPKKCVVPKLKGKTLSQAKTALSKAHCRLGKVHKPRKPKHRRLRKLVVKSSSPGRRAVRPAGTKVNLTLGEVPKPKPKHKKHK